MDPIRNLTDLLNAGAQHTAEAIVRLGGSVAELIRSLLKRFGSSYKAPRQSAEALFRRAERSVATANELSQGNLVPVSDIPSLPSSPEATQYEYGVIVRIRIGNQWIKRRVNIKSRRPLSPEDIAEEARTAVNDGTGNDTLLSGSGADVLRSRIADITVDRIISVWRR